MPTIDPALARDLYQERAVAFVDILGFGNLVKRADQNSSLRTAIVDALRRIRSVAPPQDSNTDLRVQNFSDSLIMSATGDANGFWHLALTLDLLAFKLLDLGLLVRGGVTFGGIHHDDEIVFGVGVNEAYRLESLVAKYPRIIFSREAISRANSFTNLDEVYALYRTSRMRRGEDGIWHLNILNDLGCFSRQERSESSKMHPWYSQGENLRGILQDLLDQTVDQPEIYAKFEWFARYWNSEVATKADGTPTIIDPLLLAGQEPRGLTLPFRSS